MTRKTAYIVIGAVVLFAVGLGGAIWLNGNPYSSSTTYSTSAAGFQADQMTVQSVANGTTYYAPDTTNPALRALNIQTYTGTYDADTQYLGKCSVVTPPKADPCDAAAGMIRYSFWDSLVNATLYKNWAKANPGELARMCVMGSITDPANPTGPPLKVCVSGHMATPLCGNGTGLVQDMKTQFGAALFAAVQTYACALGNGPMAIPTASPPPLAGASDKTPPSAPGPITAQTQPLTTTAP